MDVKVYFPVHVDVKPKVPLVDVVPREKWGALPPKSVEPLKTPVNHFRYTYTGTPVSTDKTQNEETLRKIQKVHMEKLSLPDIQYSFLIGGDGTVYEGRGWTTDSWKPKQHEHLKGKSIDVAYMGDFAKDEPNWEMMKTAQNILKFALENNYLEKPYNVTHMRE